MSLGYHVKEKDAITRSTFRHCAKTAKGKTMRERSNKSLARSCRSKVMISRGQKPYDQSNDLTKRSLSSRLFAECSTDIVANGSNVIASDIVELFCKNQNANHVELEERQTYAQISDSTEHEKDVINMCSTCKDCAECQLQDKTTKIRKTMNSNDRNEGHFDFYEKEANETASMSNAVTTIEHKTPILVDLTREESKITWKQTILKRFGNAKNLETASENAITNESDASPHSHVMIADSSSRLQRSNTGSSLATALKARSSCVIPVQPNRSLPIRPAPPTPTRSATSIVTSRKMRSPILKLSKPMNFDVVEVQSEKSSSGVLTSELNKFPLAQQGEKNDGVMLTSELIERSDYILPDMTNVVQIAQEVNSIKRENGEDRTRECEKEITMDIKKHRKSHEVDNSDERVKNILKEYSRMCSGSLTDKGEKRSQNVVLGLWDDKRCSSIVVSTTGTEMENAKEICNKVVPPLRLKKIVREASSTDEYRNVEVNDESGNELNYRIVTGATPRPKSPSWYSASFWSSVSSEKDLDKPTLRDKSRRSSPKSNGYKIKYRRNRLRQKLRELRGKALKLSREMAACSNNADTSPQRSTRLRQMMNCYEKQIENVSKLLCKLSASIPPASSNDVVDLDCENELDEDRAVERTTPDTNNIEQALNGTAKASASVSPSLSPGPPKLSTPSPIDYEKGKSPDKVRDSPPVLPRIYIAIQPMTLECLKQNLDTAKSWHTGSDNSSGLSLDKGTKVLNDIDRTIAHSGVTDKSTVSPVSSSEFKNSGNGSTEWNVDGSSSRLSLVMKNAEIKEKILENTKTFNNVEERLRATSPISSDNFLGSTENIEVGDTRGAREPAAVQEYLGEIVTQTSETQVVDKQTTREKQGEKQEQSRSNKVLPSSSPSILEATKNTTEYMTYDSGERINDEDRTVASTVNAAQEASTTIGRSQVPASNVNILQMQSNYYSSSVVPDTAAFTIVTQTSKNTQKVTTSVSQSATLNPTMSLAYTQAGPTVSSSNQQCVVLPNSCSNEATQKSTDQRNDGNRIMTEQFPTLGNWVARMSKKQANKSKSKLQSGGVTLPTASTAEVARVPGLETQKIRVGVPSIATRSNIVNVAPQWNTERCQRQQHHQQLYAPAVRPGICPPISVTQFYPPNYAIDPYGGGTAFGYHSAMYPYGDYSYHSRLHAAAPPTISGYQIPLQDSHTSSLRQIQHLDRRFPAHLQDAATRHFSTDLLKYPTALSAAGNYQHTTSGLDFDRLRTATAATQNGATASATCLPPLLLPPPPSLPATAQQTRAAPLAGYPASNGQCGRNRMIPDVVAAAAAAAVVAAASFDRQRGPLPPPYARTDAEMVSGAIGNMIDNESAQLMANRAASRERLPEQVQSVAGGISADSRLNNSSYRHLQNLSLDRVPYVRTSDNYSQPTIFGDNTQEAAASSVSSSTYESNVIPTSNTLTSREVARRENRNCDTPHLGKVNRTPDTTSNLECSNCGRTGSMFKCLGCEAAFYCDERCQARHWNIHVEECPKRMPKLKKLL